MTEGQDLFQLVVLLIKVERLCREHRLAPPILVDATDFDGRVWNFDFNPEFDSLELLLSRRTLPITLQLRDAAGTIIEDQITDLTMESEADGAVCDQQNAEIAI